ncbi:hypothetical protein HF086_000815 [Spodoptera exigua]|uniref:PiggyBac transposable element-derived protein domain-containing protein n=1 Tax=Spodoptera exigua TaxID=7107 RepID=A0A922MER1_SPOEX|nr:hypothetical protein HF086_000815 [Spodoptera exigua]
MSSRPTRSASRLPHLSNEELENILVQFEDSEDGLDYSDDDDVADPSYILEQNNPYLRQDSDEEPEAINLENQENDILPPISENNTSTTIHPYETPPTVPEPSTSSVSISRSTRVPKTNVIWKTKNLELNEDQERFRGSSKLPNEILELQTPYQVFSYLFTDDIVDLIRDETNLYSVQKDASRPISVTSQEIRQFVGIIYFMSIIHLPNVRTYWSEKFGYSHIRETMTLKRFELLRETLHFNDNSKMLPYEIAETLVKYKRVNRLKRTSDVEALIQDKKKKGPCQYIPPKDVRLDQLGHWPAWTVKRLRCKYPGCTGTAQTECEKCGIALCFNKNNNCFKSFHIS